MIAILGDLQRTSWLERAIGREQNDAPRARLVRALADEPLERLVLLGDLLPRRLLDGVLAPFRARAIPIEVVLGNHDGRGDPERFPSLAQAPWGVRRHGEIGLVLLDSNQRRLGRSAWAEQSTWLEENLAGLDADAGVAAVLVFCHHPPFTNSRVTGDERHVQEAFLGPFRRSRKARALFAGHAHAYERFESGGRHFVVSGGGGGPRVRLLEGDRRRHEDLYRGPSPRPFHYLLLDSAGGAVRVRAKGFDSSGTPIRVFDEFAL